MMTSPKGLLTENEIVKFTPVRLGFNPCTLRELYRVEYAEAVSCIGFDLWSAMVGSLADYSSAGAFEADRTYEPGEAVVWQGNYRVATTQTDRQPSVATDWKDAPKFNPDIPCGSTYEDFYCNYLAPYLAFSALANRLPYIVTQITDGGLDYAGRKINIQDQANYNGLKSALARDRDQALRVLDHYLRGEASRKDPCFAGYKGFEETTTCGGCSSSSCKTCNNGSRRIGGYRFG